jgi:asparagine synthase (glutamine-hydrolysing)
MCGICGVVNASTPVARTAALVERMTADLVRRGPDDEGTFVHEPSRSALGFRRLSIIDLSPAAAQPMVSADGADVLVFNGEIYNHRELRKQLEGAGVAFRSRSDTEVLLEALRRWELEALDRLRGMFAFAWFRPAAQRLVLVRDHVGIKPLYYATEPNGPGVAWSSRYDSLFRTGWLDADAVDPAVLASYLWYRRVPAPAALHRGAAQVEPGGYVVAGPDGVERAGRWWELRAVAPDLRGEAAVEAAGAAIETSVRRHLISDVPLGVFMSGGVDSPLVAGTAAKVADRPLHAFTIAVPEWDSDEGPVAERLAGPLGLVHRMRAMTAPSPEALSELQIAQHEPVNDLSMLPTMAVSELARSEVTVALSGDGGDELFFGYLRPWAVDHHRWLWRLPRRARRVPVGLLSRAGRLRFRATLHGDPGAYYRAMHRSALDDVLTAMVPGLPAPDASPFAAPAGRGRGELATFGRAVDVQVQLNRILTKVDMASMHHSLEVRVPLLDPDVIATSLRIDPSWTLAQDRTKPVLRTLLDRLVPPASVPAPKLGFSVPLADWLRGPLAPAVEDTLGEELWPSGVFDPAAVRRTWDQHRRGEEQRTIVLWGLLCLQWWGRRVRSC